MIGLPPQSRYWSDGLQASGYITVNGVPAIGATVTINGDVYTFGTDFMGNFANDISDALVAAVNADEADIEHTGVGPKPIRAYFATQYGNRVWIGASSPGTAGNAFTLATSDATNFTVSGATLSGGTAAASSGTTTANQGAANTNPNAWPVKVVQDGVNAVDQTHPLFVELSDGTNPLGTTGNRLFVQGSVTQGTAAVIGAPWPTQLSDGAAALGVQANPIIVDDQRISSAPSSTAILTSQTTLASNSSRKRFGVQNLGTAALFVNMGVTASATQFQIVLKGGTANDDGNGGLMVDSDYTGAVTVFSSGYRYTLWEQT